MATLKEFGRYFLPKVILEAQVADALKRKEEVTKQMKETQRKTGRLPHSGIDPLITSYDDMVARLRDAERGPLGIIGRKRRLGLKA